MPVDYGKTTVKEVLAKVPETKLEPGQAVLGQRTPAVVNVESIFLALLTAQTVAQGGVKYWANPKNTQTNITLLKQKAQMLFDAYEFAE